MNIDIYDPALCCNSGVCGAEADGALITFAADLEWLRQQDIAANRYNLSQQPMAFVEQTAVNDFLTTHGEQGLPVILLDGEIALTGRYPSRSELAVWFKLTCAQEEAQPPSAPCCCQGSC